MCQPLWRATSKQLLHSEAANCSAGMLQATHPRGDGTLVKAAPLAGRGMGLGGTGFLASRSRCFATSLAARCLMYCRSATRSCHKQQHTIVRSVIIRLCKATSDRFAKQSEIG